MSRACACCLYKRPSQCRRARDRVEVAVVANHITTTPPQQQLGKPRSSCPPLSRHVGRTTQVLCCSRGTKWFFRASADRPVKTTRDDSRKCPPYATATALRASRWHCHAPKRPKRPKPTPSTSLGLAQEAWQHYLCTLPSSRRTWPSQRTARAARGPSAATCATSGSYSRFTLPSTGELSPLESCIAGIFSTVR